MSKSLRLSAAVAAVCILAVLTQAQIQPTKPASYKEKVLYAFTGHSDGWAPSDLLVRAGKLSWLLSLGYMSASYSNAA
jgi:hypothetical protein